MRVLGPQFGETVYICKVNGARKVKSDAQVAINKNSRTSAEIVSLGVDGRRLPQLNFF